MAGDKTVACCCSTNQALGKKLGIPSALQGLAENVVVSHIKIRDTLLSLMLQYKQMFSVGSAIYHALIVPYVPYNYPVVSPFRTNEKATAKMK